MNEHQRVAIKAIETVKGEGLDAFRRICQHKTSEEMQQPYWKSGKTYAATLSDYEYLADQCDKAIAWVKEQSPKSHNIETEWETVPIWANFSAIDQSGVKYLYAVEPLLNLETSVWIHQKNTEYLFYQIGPDQCDEWDKTLRQRP